MNTIAGLLIIESSEAKASSTPWQKQPDQLKRNIHTTMKYDAFFLRITIPYLTFKQV